MNRLNIPVTHLIMPILRKIVMNGYWLQDPEMVRKGKKPNNVKTES